MHMEALTCKMQKTFDKMTRKKHIHESVLVVENAAGDVSCRLAYGGKDSNTPILTASVTKLFTTACIFMLQEQGKLMLDDKLAKYLSEDIMRQLHIYKGQDFSNTITLAHLLFQRSGLRDAIEEGGRESKKRALYEDKQTSFDDMLNKTKQITPYFAPGSGGRAHYTNINFDLLGKVIEKITNLPLDTAYRQMIFEPLELKNTYLAKDANDFIPNVYYKDVSLHLPNAISSIGASGGCVSTADDLMLFIKAFFGGKLFSQAFFDELANDNRLQASMYPIRYGAGFMKISLGGLSTLFMGKGQLIGHAGSTGSFAFYYPEKEMFFVGDVNQAASPAIPVQLVMKLAMKI